MIKLADSKFKVIKLPFGTRLVRNLKGEWHFRWNTPKLEPLKGNALIRRNLDDARFSRKILTHEPLEDCVLKEPIKQDL